MPARPIAGCWRRRLASELTIARRGIDLHLRRRGNDGSQVEILSAIIAGTGEKWRLLVGADLGTAKQRMESVVGAAGGGGITDGVSVTRQDNPGWGIGNSAAAPLSHLNDGPGASSLRVHG